MVKTAGKLIPLKFSLIKNEIPKQFKMLKDITYSTWDALIQPDMISGNSFTPNAIIANPIAYGHIHCAEKLGIPLTIMFPQPYTFATSSFPHPLANLSYHEDNARINFMSYRAVDALMWKSLANMINKFRVDVLNLPKIRLGEHGRNLLQNVPHVFLWSPTLLPAPAEWQDTNIVDVVGYVMPETKRIGNKLTKDQESILSFTSKCNKQIVFCGFGSMVMDKGEMQKVTQMLTHQADILNINIIFQSSWSDMKHNDLGVESNHVLFIQGCPHDWLFQHVDATIIHGGSGTTMASLKAGNPTFIVPFFGDQHLWGYAVAKNKLGPDPIPIQQLNDHNIFNSLTILLSECIVDNAKNFSKRIATENGALDAVRAFYKRLPINDMQCDLIPAEVATTWLTKDGLKLSNKAISIIKQSYSLDAQSLAYAPVEHGNRGPLSMKRGFVMGGASFVHECCGAIKDVLTLPVEALATDKHKLKTPRVSRCHAFAMACGKGTTGIFIRPLKGVGLWIDKTLTGRANRLAIAHRVTASLWKSRNSKLLYGNTMDRTMSIQDLRNRREYIDKKRLTTMNARKTVYIKFSRSCSAGVLEDSSLTRCETKEISREQILLNFEELRMASEDNMRPRASTVFQ